MIGHFLKIGMISDSEKKQFIRFLPLKPKASGKNDIQ